MNLVRREEGLILRVIREGTSGRHVGQSRRSSASVAKQKEVALTACPFPDRLVLACSKEPEVV